MRSILEAGSGVPTVAEQGELLDTGLPEATTRSLDAYRLEALG